MEQAFRDCCRHTQHREGGSGLIRLWVHTLLDLIITAIEQHMRVFAEGDKVMNNIRIAAQAITGCAGIGVFLYALIKRPMPFWNLGVLLCFAIGPMSLALILTRSATLHTARGTSGSRELCLKHT